jgi:hypothetical protein
MDPELLRQLQLGCLSGMPVVIFEAGVLQRAERELKIKGDREARMVIGKKPADEFQEDLVASRNYRNNPGHTLENYLFHHRGAVGFLSFFPSVIGTLIVKSLHRAEYGSMSSV